MRRPAVSFQTLAGRGALPNLIRLRESLARTFKGTEKRREKGKESVSYLEGFSFSSPLAYGSKNAAHLERGFACFEAELYKNLAVSVKKRPITQPAAPVKDCTIQKGRN